MSQTEMASSGRLQQLRGIVSEVLELEPGELTMSSNFVNDYEADSLDAIEIIARIERDMGVRIPNEALPEMIDLSAAIDIVNRYGGAQEEANA
jgi:acyl carrier protein